MSTRSTTQHDTNNPTATNSGGNGRGAAHVTHGNGTHTNGGSAREEIAQVARALGWFSIGLGLAQIVAPHRISRMLGIQGGNANLALMRAIGVREIASGVGILTQQNPSGWLRARVGGDAMDLALLTKAMSSDDTNRGRAAAAAAAVIGVTAVDTMASVRMSREQQPSSNGVGPSSSSVPRIASAITVNAPIGDVFAAWEGFRNLPRFMDSFATVGVTDDDHSRWQAALPGGRFVAWDAVITESVPNERIVWSTSEGSRLNGSGQVRFRSAPGDRGVEVLFEAQFDPPGGELGNRIAGLFTDPLGVKLNNDLRRCKQLMELGEIVTSDDSMVKGPNPAQPVNSVHAS